MEVDNIVSALEQTLFFLRKSESSLYGHLSVEEVIRQLENELDKARNFHVVDFKQLSFLFGPTGSIEEISIDNGWGEEFLEISKTF